MRRWIPLSLVAAAIAGAWVPSDAQETSFVTVKQGRFIDPEGRQVLLHGINVGSKSKAENYLSWHTPREFAAMRAWGFNCIRLLILWDGVEPEPGVYDDEYLEGVDKRIRWAKDNGLCVLLDMHQDLYGVKFSDGAPEWATLDEGKPHVKPGPVWSDAYMTSPAVQTAFDNFWADKPAPDGVGVQEHFAAAWRHVAERYAAEPAVVGYDLLNEPFMGSLVAPIQLAMLEGAAKGLAAKYGENAPDMATIATQWLTEDGRSALFKELADLAVLAPAVEAASGLSQEFDRTMLSPMLQRVGRAIREVDKHHILFIEPNLFATSGIPPGIQPITGPEGAPDPLQAYAPHAYDMVTDTKDVSQASEARVAFIFQRHAETAARLGMPVLIGEWGAYGMHRDTLGPARAVVRQLEKHLFSDTYWDFVNGIERTDCFPVLARPYPMAVAGVLVRCESDNDTREFRCAWREDSGITAPTRVYVPRLWYSVWPPRVALEPEGEVSVVPLEGTGSGYLEMPPTDTTLERSLTLSPASAAEPGQQ